MKLKIALVSACLGTALFAVGASGQAVAAKPAASGAPNVIGPSKIAIINIQQAIATSQEGKKLLAQLQTRFAPRQKDLASQQQEITKLQGQLNAGGNTMSTDAKNELSQEIASKQRDYQQSAQNAQTDIQDAETNVMNTVGTKMMPILQSYAKQHGYTAVIDVSMSWPQSPILYYNPGTEITGEIVKLYDEKYPVASTSSATK